MGGSSWSNDLYRDRQVQRKSTGTATFAHSAAVRSGRTSRAIHASLDPKGILDSVNKVREARDSDAHPDSTPVAVFFDVTGSMGSIPKTLQAKLDGLMTLLLDKAYCKDPQILMGAIGDYHSDRAPLQIGQFESGVEMDNDLTNIYLEGMGGGSGEESYQNAFYFASRKTAMDCWEKRGKKGFLFIIGDELPYGGSSPTEISGVFGDTVSETITTQQLIKEAKEKFHVFFLIPGGAAHSRDNRLRDTWSDLLGPENVIALDNPDLVCETIGATVGMFENSISLDTIQKDLGGSREALTVRKALDALSTSNAVAAGVPKTSGKKGGAVRL